MLSCAKLLVKIYFCLFKSCLIFVSKLCCYPSRNKNCGLWRQPTLIIFHNSAYLSLKPPELLQLLEIRRCCRILYLAWWPCWILAISNLKPTRKRMGKSSLRMAVYTHKVNKEFWVTIFIVYFWTFVDTPVPI